MDHNDMYMAGRAKVGDIEDISRIYREAFPEHTRSLLGLKTCIAYFKAIYQHDSYYLAVSINNKKTVSGFAVLHINRLESLGGQWLFSDPISILYMVARNPDYLYRRLLSRLKGLIRKRRLALRGVKPTRKPPVFPLRATGYIDSIAVTGSARNQGAGKLLINHCTEIAKDNGLKFINLTVDAYNRPAIEFYKKLNFYTVVHNPSTNSFILSLSLDES